MNTEQAKALNTITALMRKHSLTADDVSAALLRQPDAAGGNTMLTRLFSYIGAIFIFAGLCTYAAMVWDDLNSYARVVITMGPGIVALVLGLATLNDPRYARASTPLFVMAFFLEPLGLFVFLKEFFDGDNAKLAALVVFGGLAAQMGLLFYARERTSLVFFTLVYAFLALWAGFELLDFDGDSIACLLGLSGLMVAYGLDRTPWRGFVPFAYFIFAGCLSIGLYEILEGEDPFDILLIGAAALMVLASVRAQSRSLLVASVLTMIGYLCYYTDEYFADIVSWPIALVVLGFMMIGISAYAVKLAQKISASPN